MDGEYKHLLQRVQLCKPGRLDISRYNKCKSRKREGAGAGGGGLEDKGHTRREKATHLLRRI